MCHSFPNSTTNQERKGKKKKSKIQKEATTDSVYQSTISSCRDMFLCLYCSLVLFPTTLSTPITIFLHANACKCLYIMDVYICS